MFLTFSTERPLWQIIDQRWNNQLHRPLHVVNYYLNPMLPYNPEFKVHNEIKHRMYDCLDRLVGDIDEISNIDADRVLKVCVRVEFRERLISLLKKSIRCLD